MRLNAYLARAGVASRRKADELIKAGRVAVNGEAGQLNTFVGAGDVVQVDGEAVERQRLSYVLLHKPVGELTVVGKQENTGRIGVEPTDWDDARLVANEIDDRPSPVGVVGCRHDARRLMEQHVGQPLPLDRLAVDLDHVA